MLPENPIIFLLEDCPNAAFLVERTVLKELPNARLLWARSLEEATARAEGLDIELFLTDINLPDGNGLDFLWQMSEAHPLARAIVMTATPLPEHEATTAALGVLYYIEKPLNVPLFLTYLRQALGTEHVTGGSQGWRAYEGPANPQGTEQHFRATLANLSVVDILQLKCLTRATTAVEFRSGGLVGSIHFEDGEIIDAEAGAVRGVDAVYEIVGWKNGEVSEQPLAAWGKRTIRASWHSLLMEASQQLDERTPAV
jgi:DNA-binding response OmpR family regulator